MTAVENQATLLTFTLDGESVSFTPGETIYEVAIRQQKDVPTLMALIYVQAIVVLVSILLTDILYVFVDPRISFESQGKGQ